MSDYFNKGRSGSGRPSFGPKRFGGGNKRPFGDRSFAPKAQFEAECASCHKMCQVPFAPSGRKPVYCRDCFGGQERGTAPRREFAPAAPRVVPDKRIDDIRRDLETLTGRIEDLAAQVEKLANSLALSAEVRRIAAAEPEAKAKRAPAKKSAPKTAKKK